MALDPTMPHFNSMRLWSYVVFVKNLDPYRATANTFIAQFYTVYAAFLARLLQAAEFSKRNILPLEKFIWGFFPNTYDFSHTRPP